MSLILLLKEKIVKKAIAVVLREIRLKVSRGWTQKSLSRDKYGSTISPFVPGAASYSIIGALLSVKTHPKLQLLTAKLLAVKIKALDPKTEFRTLSEWNDRSSTDQNAIIKVIDLALVYVNL